MSVTRVRQTASPLASGQLLVAGGSTYNGATVVLASAERYDPATGAWRMAASMATPRYDHTATVLASGRVLVVGGYDGSNNLASAELYDPATDRWQPAGSLAFARARHTATLLPSGKVLVVGGLGSSGFLARAELYDPATDRWTDAAPLAHARQSHSASLLQDGNVMVVGGSDGTFLDSCEIYDAQADHWTTVASIGLNYARSIHAAVVLPSGKVLIAGGNGYSGRVARLYDPTTDAWSDAGTVAVERGWPNAILLPSGKVLMSGGYQPNNQGLASVEFYDPQSNTWSAGPSMAVAHVVGTSSLLSTGKVLVAGGTGTNATASVEIFDPAASTWDSAAALSTRYLHGATVLLSGELLVAGGSNFVTGPLATTQRYDPTSNQWRAAAPLAHARYLASTTLLASGQVLVSGGNDANGNPRAAERYDPVTDTWSAAGTLAEGRAFHSATLLPSGRVLVVGGLGATTLASAEQYDPLTNAWSPVAGLAGARLRHTASLLPSGKVLVVGGKNDAGDAVATAELFDPANGTWTSAGSLTTSRWGHTATLLPSGLVLVAGGIHAGNEVAGAELYDPATNVWSATGTLATARYTHSATVLPTGQVLIAGGKNGGSVLSSAELYDPARHAFTPAGNLATRRQWHSATLMPAGRILLCGGFDGTVVLADCEGYRLDASPVHARKPNIAAVNDPLAPGDTLQVTGSGFDGDSEAAGGYTNSSPSNVPAVQLRRIDNEQIVWLAPPADSVRSDTAYRGASAFALAKGAYALTVFVDGIASTSTMFRVVALHAVTATAGNGGTIDPAGTQEVEEGRSASFTLTPDAHHHLVDVAGSCGGTLDGSTYVSAPVTSDCSIEASFAADTYSVTATAHEHGDVQPAQQSVVYGATASVELLPAPGYHVAGVTGTCGGNLDGAVFTTTAVEADCSIEAHFAIDTFTVSASTDAHGTIDPASQVVNAGAQATVVVTPSAGYHVASIDSGCGGHLDGDVFVTDPVGADCAINFAFGIDVLTVTGSGGAHGQIGPASQMVEFGEPATLSVVPDAGYHASASGCDGALIGTVYATAPVVSDCTVVALFTIDTYTVTTIATAHGQVAPATQSVTYGDVARATLTPDPGYQAVIDAATTCPDGSFNGIEYTSGPILGPCVISASFVFDPSALRLHVDDGRPAASYDQLLTYTVTLSNEGSGDALGVTLADTFPDALDVSQSHWICVGGAPGSACTPSGSGPLQDTGVALPAGQSLSWIVTAPVRPDASGGIVEYAVSASLGADGVVAKARDSDLLVLLRNGFEPAEAGGPN